MAWEKFHIFLKTSLIADKYDSEKIVENQSYNSKRDYLHIQSRRNRLREILLEIFDALKYSFNLEFLLNDEDFPYEKFQDTQIIFPLEKQIEVVNSINALYTCIEKRQLNLDMTDLSNLIHEAKLIETSKFSFEDNDTFTETIWTLELIRRFFEVSIQEKKTIVKYETN